MIEVIIDQILDERLRQDKKFGSQRKIPMHMWNTILNEEVGEVSRAILESEPDNLRDELIQVAAVSIAMVEAIDDDRMY